MKRLCVYCGSSVGTRIEYLQAAGDLASVMVERGISLVYGGGGTGIMGAVADAVLEAGGEAVGVITRDLMDLEVGHNGLDEMHIVDTMHERKQMMAELADGFISLPGGLGTLEEMFETLTWSQLGIHQKPCGMLNVCGYYDNLTAFLKHAAEEGFIKEAHREMLLVDEDPAKLLLKLEKYRHILVKKV